MTELRGLRRSLVHATASCAVLATLWLILPRVMAEEPTRNDAPFDVEAGALVVDADSGQAHFSGGVVARRGAWELRAPELHVYYADGVFERAEATGPVEFSGEGLQAEAAAAHFSSDTDTVVLEGTVVVRRGDNTLEGKRAIIHLEAAKVEMEQVRGRVRLDALFPDGT